jgi:voltage-gated potassium channel
MKKKKTGSKLLLAVGAYLLLLYLLSIVESPHEKANIKSFADAWWYSMVTLTTVGYGDFYPVTPAGKFLSLLFILGSLGLLGFIIGKATEFISEINWRRQMGHYGTSFENHIVIVGWNNFAHSMIKDLIQAGQQVAIITNEKNHIDLIYAEFSSEKVFCLFSDLKNISMFEKASISKAAMIFVNLSDDTEKLICMLNIRKEYPGVHFVLALENSDLSDTFYSAGATFVLSKNEIASKLMASYIFEPDVADMTNDLLSISQKSEEYDIKEFKIINENPLAGKNYGEVFAELKSKFNVLAIGLSKTLENGTRKLIKLPPDQTKVESGDYLIVIMSGNEAGKIKEMFKINEGIVY